MSGTTSSSDVLSLSVHGPVGVLDLAVPAAASGADVAAAYARQAGLSSVPALHTRLGALVPPRRTLAELGLVTGAVLVALEGDPAPMPRRSGRVEGRPRPRLVAGPLSALWCSVAVGLALLAGWAATSLPASSAPRGLAIGLLVGAAVVGSLPIGPLAGHRVPAVPAYAGAAAMAVAWDPAPERLATILGLGGLAAAVAAAVARALDQSGEEGLRVWMVTGVGVFLLTGLAALADVDAQVGWAVLLAVAMLAARFVPGLAVAVPDRYLLDLDRLAVTAWSARDRPVGRRGRMVVPRQAVASVVASGARTVTASCVAILVVATGSAVLALREATVWIDVVGIRCEVGLVGAALLLAARSYRHAAARTLLCLAGLACWVALLADLFADLPEDPGRGWLAVAAPLSIGLGVLLVPVAVALGRGWRSAAWSRRAEVAEALCGAAALGSVVVAAGLFGALWELTG